MARPEQEDALDAVRLDVLATPAPPSAGECTSERGRTMALATLHETSALPSQSFNCDDNRPRRTCTTSRRGSDGGFAALDGSRAWASDEEFKAAASKRSRKRFRPARSTNDARRHHRLREQARPREHFIARDERLRPCQREPIRSASSSTT